MKAHALWITFVLVIVGCAPAQNDPPFLSGVVFRFVHNGACTASGLPSEKGIYDLDVDAGAVPSLELPLMVTVALGPSRTVPAPPPLARVFFSADGGDTANALFDGRGGLPIEPADARSAPLALFRGPIALGLDDVEFYTEEIVTATLVTSEEASLLRADPFVQGELDSHGLARITANIALASAEKAIEPYPIVLCNGCLTHLPFCESHSWPPHLLQPIANPQACAVGVDVPAFVCPDD